MPTIAPATSTPNFTPTSIADGSSAAATAGTADVVQIVAGNCPGRDRRRERPHDGIGHGVPADVGGGQRRRVAVPAASAAAGRNSTVLASVQVTFPATGASPGPDELELERRRVDRLVELDDDRLGRRHGDEIGRRDHVGDRRADVVGRNVEHEVDPVVGVAPRRGREAAVGAVAEHAVAAGRLAGRQGAQRAAATPLDPNIPRVGGVPTVGSEVRHDVGRAGRDLDGRIERRLLPAVVTLGVERGRAEQRAVEGPQPSDVVSRVAAAAVVAHRGDEAVDVAAEPQAQFDRAGVGRRGRRRNVGARPDARRQCTRQPCGGERPRDGRSDRRSGEVCAPDTVTT